MDPKLEEALDALVESNKTNTTAIGTLAESVKALVDRAAAEDAAKAKEVEEAEKDKAPKLADIVAALDEAELPKTARASVVASVEAGVPLQEAIDAKKAEVTALLEESGSSFNGNVNNEKKPATLEESVAPHISAAYGI